MHGEMYHVFLTYDKATHQQVIDWCLDNNWKLMYSRMSPHGCNYYFGSKEDVLAFKLKWE